MLKNVYVRGVGGQKWAKFCLRSFWTTPKIYQIFISQYIILVLCIFQNGMRLKLNGVAFLFEEN